MAANTGVEVRIDPEQLARVRITPSMVRRAAEVIDPLAMDDAPYVLGCGSGWHYEAHSFHSVCRCGSSAHEGREPLRRRQLEDRARARETAREVLKAALRGV